MAAENPETPTAETPENPETPDAAEPPETPAEGEQPAEGEGEGKPDEEKPADEGKPPEEKDAKSAKSVTIKDEKSKTDVEERPKGQCMSPTPSGEELPEGDFEKIIQDSLEILLSCQKKMDEQKVDTLSLSFLLSKIEESLDSYSKDYMPTLNTFLFEADKITANYYACMCCKLPKYGDYVIALEERDEREGPIDDGEGNAVGKDKVLSLVKGVTENYYLLATIVRSMRGVMNIVNKTKDLRRNLVCEVYKHLPTWGQLQNNVTCHLDSIREEAFKTTACVDFLKQGETAQAPNLDFSILQTV